MEQILSGCEFQWGYVKILGLDTTVIVESFGEAVVFVMHITLMVFITKWISPQKSNKLVFMKGTIWETHFCLFPPHLN